MTPDPVNSEFSELERRVDRGLKALPPPAAPPMLASRVMSRVLQEGRPVFEWPIALKVALTAGGFALIVGALLAWPLALELARTSWQSPVVVLIRAAIETARPMIPGTLMYVTAMCVVCAAAASMLKHVALGGASNQ